MKVELKPTTITNQKTNFFTRVRKFISAKLKPLSKDTFEKSTVEQTGKKIIVSRKHPNWCDAPEDGYRNNTIARTRCFYPEDIKKMEAMTEDEAILYKEDLYKNGRFYYGECDGTLKELEEFLNSCGIKLEDVLSKNQK